VGKIARRTVRNEARAERDFAHASNITRDVVLG
jgi:hypothetical protein